MKILAADKQDLPKLIIFHALSCHRCVQVKQEVLPAMENEFKDQIIFQYRDVGQLENYKMALGLLQKNGSGISFQTPLFYFGGKFLTAEGQVRDNLRNFILEGLKVIPPSAPPATFDLTAYFKGFTPAAIIIAGLEDGVNPCAFTVIVFFISFLAAQGYRRRELIFIGAAFIFAVFLTYLGIGLGIFNFFYHFKGFWLIMRLLNLITGALSILFGILAVYDFIKFKKTGATDELILKLPKSVKERIHKLVGFFYRKSPQEKQGKSLPGPYKLIFSALITGFLVSLLEAVCTGQMYLPTISFVLKASTLKLQALGYLLLYNIMFVIPLVVIFIFALMGTSSAQFSGFLKRHLGLIKILMAVLFFSLGLFLIWRA
ncbi:MAG: hypothetical protein KJ931_05075 [Candidatus Omnitrophica bacterium]|nr:hypothetical protein [Candidatus Omnitrophota bacterium]